MDNGADPHRIPPAPLHIDMSLLSIGRGHSDFPLAITTPRLNLREFTLCHADAEHLYQLESIPEVARFQTWEPWDRECASAVLAEIVSKQQPAQGAPRSHFDLAVRLKDPPRFLGHVGCKIVWEEESTTGERMGMQEPGPRALLFYSLRPDAQGCGFATEAVQALMQALPGRVSTWEIEVDPRNVPSRRVAERLGFHQRPHTEYYPSQTASGEWVNTVVYCRAEGSHRGVPSHGSPYC